MPPDLYESGSAYHKRRRWTHPHTVRCLETAMIMLGTPDSLLDVGCAEGVLVRTAAMGGIDAMGIDLAAPEHDALFVRADLCQPVDLHRRFSWVLCWEVAEHLPETAADTLCDTLVRHLEPHGRLLFTAATPGQRGPGHVHCAEQAFWRGLLYDRGLTVAPELTIALRKLWMECSPRTPWYGRNISLYWRSA